MSAAPIEDKIIADMRKTIADTERSIAQMLAKQGKAPPAPKTEYRVLSALNLGRLEELASQALKQGWQLQGGVTSAKEGNHGYYFYQAMVGP